MYLKFYSTKLKHNYLAIKSKNRVKENVMQQHKIDDKQPWVEKTSQNNKHINLPIATDQKNYA